MLAGDEKYFCPPVVVEKYLFLNLHFYSFKILGFIIFKLKKEKKHFYTNCVEQIETYFGYLSE